MNVEVAVLRVGFSYLGLVRLNYICRSQTIWRHCDWLKFQDKATFGSQLLSVIVW